MSFSTTTLEQFHPQVFFLVQTARYLKFSTVSGSTLLLCYDIYIASKMMVGLIVNKTHSSMAIQQNEKNTKASPSTITNELDIN